MADVSYALRHGIPSRATDGRRSRLLLVVALAQLSRYGTADEVKHGLLAASAGIRRVSRVRGYGQGDVEMQDAIWKRADATWLSVRSRYGCSTKIQLRDQSRPCIAQSQVGAM